jgi:hypothetical protein
VAQDLERYLLGSDLSVQRTTGGYHDLLHPTLHAGSVGNAMVLRHEAVHDRMFRSTRFGYLQLFFKALALDSRVSNIARERASENVRDLYQWSLLTHEAAATYISIREMPYTLFDATRHSLPDQYNDFERLISGQIDTLFPSRKVQLIVGEVICRLPLNADVLSALQKMDIFSRIMLPGDSKPDNIIKPIIRRITQVFARFGDRYRDHASRASCEREVVEFPIHDDDAWLDSPAEIAQRAEALLLETFESLLRNDSFLSQYADNYRVDYQKHESILEKLHAAYPDMRMPYHQLAMYGTQYQQGSFLETYLSLEARGLANTRWRNEHVMSLENTEVLEPSPATFAVWTEESKIPDLRVLISPDVEASIDSDYWHYVTVTSQKAEFAKVTLDRVKNIFKARSLVGQIGAPILSNVVFVNRLHLETFVSNVEYYQFMVESHKPLGGANFSWKMGNVLFYMTGDIFEWLETMSNQDRKFGALLLIPEELPRFMSSRESSIDDLTNRRAEEEEAVFLSQSFLSMKSALVLASPDNGEVFFKIMPVIASRIVVEAVSRLTQEQKLEFLDYRSGTDDEKNVARLVAQVSEFLSYVWRYF